MAVSSGTTKGLLWQSHRGKQQQLFIVLKKKLSPNGIYTASLLLPNDSIEADTCP